MRVTSFGFRYSYLINEKYPRDSNSEEPSLPLLKNIMTHRLPTETIKHVFSIINSLAYGTKRNIECCVAKCTLLSLLSLVYSSRENIY